MAPEGLLIYMEPCSSLLGDFDGILIPNWLLVWSSGAGRRVELNQGCSRMSWEARFKQNKSGKTHTKVTVFLVVGPLRGGGGKTS